MHKMHALSGLTARARLLLNGNRPKPGPVILMYHGVIERESDAVLDEYSVSIPVLRSHLRFLQRTRKIITIETLIEALRSGYEPDGRWVVLTFDDALKNQVMQGASLLAEYSADWTLSVPAHLVGTERSVWSYEVAVLLRCCMNKKEVIWPAVPHDRFRIQNHSECLKTHEIFRRRLFAMSAAERNAAVDALIGQVGRPFFQDQFSEYGEYCMASWRELRILADTGVTLVSHGATHQPLSSDMDETMWNMELVASRRVIEHEIGRPIRGFALPHGLMVKSVPVRIADAGYEYGLTSETGRVTAISDRFALPRYDAAYSLPVLRRFCLG